MKIRDLVVSVEAVILQGGKDTLKVYDCAHCVETQAEKERGRRIEKYNFMYFCKVEIKDRKDSLEIASKGMILWKRAYQTSWAEPAG